VIASGAGISVFALVSYYLKSEEYFNFMRSVTAKLFKSKKTIEEGTGEVSGV
jgi:hypothetical protein